jgi:hypothetical protein
MGSNAPNLRRFKRQELLLRLGGRLGALRATHRIALRPASSSTVLWTRNCPLRRHRPRIGCLRLSSALVYLYPREERDSVISTLRCVAFPKAILSQYQLTQSKINASCYKSVSRAWWNGRHARLRNQKLAISEGFIPFKKVSRHHWFNWRNSISRPSTLVVDPRGNTVAKSVANLKCPNFFSKRSRRTFFSEICVSMIGQLCVSFGEELLPAREAARPSALLAFRAAFLLKPNERPSTDVSAVDIKFDVAAPLVDHTYV